MRPVFLVICFFDLFVSVGCSQLKGKSFSPTIDGYDEKQRRSVILDKPLFEISGIDYINDEKLVAINDEAGKIFFVNPVDGKHDVFQFGKKGDYEDVAIVGDYYYVLRSDGRLFQVKASDHNLVNEFDGNFGKHTEFESLYYDKELRQLVLICKECGKGASEINAFRFDPATGAFLPGTYFTIDWSEIRKLGKNNQIEFRPSAASINPVTGKLFIISSISKVLLECTRTGVLERVYTINPYHFQQPEGITFASDGSMYISNEAKQGKSTILYFPYKR